MEAAELESAAKHNRGTQRANPDLGEVEKRDDESDTDDGEKVVTGIEALSSTCGTYAVSDKNGISILKKEPILLREKWSRNGRTICLKNSNAATDNDGGDCERLQYGTRIQVVDIQDGYAKLARGRGYVRAASSRIVKVGGPRDPACQIEGSLYSVASRKSKMHNIEMSLINDLEKALMKPYPEEKKSCNEEKECAGNDIQNTNQRIEYSSTEIVPVPSQREIQKKFHNDLKAKKPQKDVEDQTMTCGSFFGMASMENTCPDTSLPFDGICTTPRLAHFATTNSLPSKRQPNVAPLPSVNMFCFVVSGLS